MLVHFKEPVWMKERWGWWMLADPLLESLSNRSDVTAEMVKKLKQELEDAIPRITAKEIEQLKM